MKFPINIKFLTILRKIGTRENIFYYKQSLYKYLLNMKGSISSEVLFDQERHEKENGCINKIVLLAKNHSVKERKGNCKGK